MSLSAFTARTRTTTWDSVCTSPAAWPRRMPAPSPSRVRTDMAPPSGWRYRPAGDEGGMMDTPPRDGRHGDEIDPDGVLAQVMRYLDVLDADDGDRATEEDIIIIQNLLEAVRAARRKGYSEELLVQVLRNLIHTPPSA